MLFIHLFFSKELLISINISNCKNNVNENYSLAIDKDRVT